MGGVVPSCMSHRNVAGCESLEVLTPADARAELPGPPRRMHGPWRGPSAPVNHAVWTLLMTTNSAVWATQGTLRIS